MSENEGIPQEGYPTVPPEGYPEGYAAAPQEAYPAVPVEGYEAAPAASAAPAEGYPVAPEPTSQVPAGQFDAQFYQAAPQVPQVDPQFYQAAPQQAYQAVPVEGSVDPAAAAAAVPAEGYAAPAAGYAAAPAAAYQADSQAAYQAVPQAAVAAAPAVAAAAVPQAAAPAAAQQEPEEKKKKKKKGCLWRIIFWLALIVLIGALGTLGYLFYTYWAGQNEYDQISERAFGEPDDNATLADLVVDWDALREINPDVVAWVYVPGTVINYPVAHKDGDSEYYLHHNFSLGEGKFGAEFGSIMLSGENSGDFSDEVNILYGHHMRNGSMFAPFAEFRESEEFNKHRTIYLLTPDGNYRLTTFGVEHVPMTHASIATPNYATDEEFNEFKQWLIDNSIVDADPNTDDSVPDATKLVGFCTCDGADNTWRYITFATVSEFCPADMIGSDDYKGRKVKDTTIDKVADAADERNE